ncbi:tetratricopeptide repeat protein [Propionimicrobium sp. BV2F7]|uniref:tetratricopeptide repeat protein n=1 Tax=Propionimicrobium sp. BV2F7 TaxID=1111131 RepID=UPI0003D79701|nr:tetratricopeptide repeat protein [Propionimicrobium sp. BV2F7]ETJ97996.1 thioredoxin domain protein [Propionimicrobium sp. BV2F7]
MTDKNFSRPGAVDLSNIAGATPEAEGSSYAMNVTEAEFEWAAGESVRYPVIMIFHSPRDTAGSGVVNVLTKLANEAAGKWLLAKVDVDKYPQIAQAMRIQAVPTVVALLGGQAMPLFQGTRDEKDIAALMKQVEQAAVASGITGRAKPAAGQQTDDEPQTDPRFKAADEALAKGDYEAALKEFDKLIEANPRDAEAKAGKAQTGLLARTADVDPECIEKADADPQDIGLAFVAADVELATGQAGKAFDRLLGLIKTNYGDDREKIRVRLLELFETLPPNNEDLKKARRELSLALF